MAGQAGHDGEWPGETEGGHGDWATSGGERSRRKSLRLQVCVSGAPLMRVLDISRTRCAQNHHFDAKINIACASLGRKSHKL